MNLGAAGPGWLFCPADRPERFEKAAAAADVVILDLEDGVAEADKPAARKALQETPLDPERTVVRINAADTEEHPRDLDALAATAYTTVMLSKTESAAQVAALAPRDVIALLETPRGAVLATEIAAARGTVALMGSPRTWSPRWAGVPAARPTAAYRDVARHVRSTALLTASAFGRVALEARCIWTSATSTVCEKRPKRRGAGLRRNGVFHPSQIRWYARHTGPARRSWTGREGSDGSGAERGVFAFEGQMVDSPVLERASMVLQRAGECPGLSGVSVVTQQFLRMVETVGSRLPAIQVWWGYPFGIVPRFRVLPPPGRSGRWCGPQRGSGCRYRVVRHCA